MLVFFFFFFCLMFFSSPPPLSFFFFPEWRGCQQILVFAFPVCMFIILEVVCILFRLSLLIKTNVFSIVSLFLELQVQKYYLQRTDVAVFPIFKKENAEQNRPPTHQTHFLGSSRKGVEITRLCFMYLEHISMWSSNKESKPCQWNKRKSLKRKKKDSLRNIGACLELHSITLNNFRRNVVLQC